MAVEGVVWLARDKEVFVPVALVEYMRAFGPCPKWVAEWKNCFESESLRQGWIVGQPEALSPDAIGGARWLFLSGP